MALFHPSGQSTARIGSLCSGIGPEPAQNKKKQSTSWFRFGSHFLQDKTRQLTEDQSLNSQVWTSIVLLLVVIRKFLQKVEKKRTKPTKLKKKHFFRHKISNLIWGKFSKQFLNSNEGRRGAS